MMTLGNMRENGVRSLAITSVAGKTTEITKEETMSFSETKSHHFITTAILVSALTLCWSAEAAHRGKPRVTDAMRDVGIAIVDASYGPSEPFRRCYAYNTNSVKDVCAVFDVYNLAAVWVWWGIPPPARRVYLRLDRNRIVIPNNYLPIYITEEWGLRRRTLQCKLVSATYC